ncbi:hypothetical protein DL240_08620 [Lujinxingia litoralis]|uniref:PDZ domain-containing protein n=1 Tax=Lujinxingia litoralis TaxID=2211119 RepID=A0A328C9V0_9DELT|nr:hypothetical protein [Lujinxingia litoralis]RAL22945.1 hypothetical protein DL240_08620 [Lujinxingia litoralis]
MKRVNVMQSALSVLLLAGLMLAAVGCATAPDQRRAAERGPDHSVGAPPSGDEAAVAPLPENPASRPARTLAPREPMVGPDGASLVSRGEVEALLERGPAVVFQHVDTEPTHQGEAFVGFMIVDISTAAHAFVAPQLRVGDVVTHINLVKLERPDHYLDAWSSLADAGEIRVDFVRDGEPMHAIWRVE